MKKTVLGTLLVFVIGFTAANFLAPGALYENAMQATRWAAGFETKQIQLGEYQYTYLDNENQGKPVILMIHGFTADKDNWPRMSLFLSSDYHIIAPDLLGHGDSSRPTKEDYSISAQVERVKALADALELPKFHLIGNSMGGSISGFYAARHGDDLLSVTLLDNAGIHAPSPSDMDKQLAEGGPMPLIMGSREDVDQFFDYVFVSPPLMTGSIRNYFANKQIPHYALYTSIFDEFGREKMEDLSLELSNINVPVQIIWGDKDRLLDVSSIEVMTPLLENERVVIFENCGHTPMLERPKQTADTLRSFIESL